jgi:hypothetical protein
MAEWTGENSLIINLEMRSYNSPDNFKSPMVECGFQHHH